MAQVRRRGPNRYTISIYLGRDLEGKREYVHETFHGGPKDANKRAIQLEAELQKRIGSTKGPKTMEELMDQWLKHIQKTLYIRTYEKYVWHVERLKPIIGDLVLLKTRSLDLQTRLDNLNGLAQRTLKDLYSTVRSITKQALGWGILSVDISAGLRIPKAPRVDRDVLDKEELQALLEAAKGFKHYPVIYLLGVTGMRISEALGLKWKNVDLNKGTICIKQATDTVKRKVKDEPKNVTSYRTIILDPDTFQLLKQLKQPGVSKDQLVFTADQGRPLRYNAVRLTLVRALKKSNLRHIRIHDLRHGVGSILLDEGASVTTAANLLGQQPATFVGVYAQKLRTGQSISGFFHKDTTADKSADKVNKTL